MRLIIEGARATLEGPFSLEAITLIAGLAGSKKWSKTASVSIDAMGANLRKLRARFPEMEVEDRSGAIAAMEELSAMHAQHESFAPRASSYTPKKPLWTSQQECLELSWDRKTFAHFLDCGTGKTAINIATAGRLYSAGLITGMLVNAPKGVHTQWLEEAFPEHFSGGFTPYPWKGKPIKWPANRANGLEVFAINTDGIRTDKGFDVCFEFLTRHEGKSLLIVDESHNFMSPSAERTKRMWRLAERATYKRILTGTPIAKNIADVWAQYKILDERILGFRFFSSFKAHFCVLKQDAEGNEFIVGQRNTEEYYALVAPHTYRKTKEEMLGLPEKVYNRRVYEMGPKTRQHYLELKQTLLTQLDNGEIVDAKNGVGALLRMQQVLCGYLPTPTGELVEISDERIRELIEIIKQVSGSVVIWARFSPDIRRIEKALEALWPDSCVTYYGDTSDAQRKINKAHFVSGERRFFIGNPAAGGTGVDGLQKVAEHAVYYSNSFNAVHRWQSEDRTHRGGMRGSAIYHDLIARGSVDNSFLANLRAKRSVSDLTLDDIRRALG